MTEPIHLAFARRAARHPDRTAIVVGGDSATYRELAIRAGGVRRALIGRRPAAIGGYFEHSIGGVAAFLGVLGSGSWYVPMAPVQGRTRVASVVAESAASTVLTDSHLSQHLAGIPTEVINLADLRSDVGDLDTQGLAFGEGWPDTATRLAYVIYTSGSTGRPKGIAISQGALAASTVARCKLYGDGGTLFLAAPFCFDSSISMFAPLTSGGTVIFSSPGADRDAVRLATEATAATHALLLPTVYGQLLEVWGIRQPSQLAVAIVAGESVSPALVGRHFSSAPTRRLINEYGPTEATVFCTAHECTRVDATSHSVPIGRPVHGYRTTVLDPEGFETPSGTVGEICVNGAGLADGYLGDPALTARRFVPASRGGRWYRTGDLGRKRPGGMLEFIGRIDDQVKLRGIRLELAEVETMLTGVDGVGSAACVVTGEHLVGFIRVQLGAHVQIDTCLARLRRDFPAYMVPQTVHIIDALPMTANGKIDRAALAVLALARLEPPVRGGRPASADALSAVIAAVESVLGIRLGPEDAFVSHGDSLAAMRVGVRLHTMGWTAHPVELLDGGSLRAAAANTVRRSALPIGAAPVGPLSPSQLAIWYADRLNPGTTAFTIPLRLSIGATLDPAGVRRAFEHVVDRHPILRCRIAADGAGRPIAEFREDPVNLDVADLTRDVGSGETSNALASLEGQVPIDPATEPPLRGLLILLPGRRSELLLTVHHVVCDGWAQLMLIRELADAYNGIDRSRPLDFREYAARAFAADQRGDHDAAARAAAGLLDGAPPILSLREGRRSVPRLHAAGQVTDLPCLLRQRLDDLASSQRVTLYTVLLAGFATAVADVAGQRSFVIGSVTAQRPELDLEETIGQFANVVPIALDLDRDADRLAHVRSRLLAALHYADVPFQRVVEAVATQRDVHFAPVVQVIFEYFAPQAPPVQFDGVAARINQDGLQQGAVCDLSMRVFPRGDGLRCVTVHDSSVVGAATAERVVKAARAAWWAMVGRRAPDAS